MRQSEQEDLFMKDVANRAEEMRRSIKSTVRHFFFMSAWIFMAKAPFVIISLNIQKEV